MVQIFFLMNIIFVISKVKIKRMQDVGRAPGVTDQRGTDGERVRKELVIERKKDIIEKMKPENSYYNHSHENGYFYTS